MSTAPTYKPLEIEVIDFGPIAKAKLDLRPLTVFVGPSNTGKSYLAMLIYALHRFFGGDTTNSDFSSMALSPRTYPRLLSSAWSSRVQSQARSRMNNKEMSKEECHTLIDWVTQMLARAQEEGFPEDFRASVPCGVTALFVPLFEHVSTLANLLEWEIARCFGSEDLSRLIRHGSRTGSSVILKRHVSSTYSAADPFTYGFFVNGDRPVLTASIPDKTPLLIESNDVDPWYREKIRQLGSRINISSYQQSSRPRVVESLRNELVDFVAPYTVSPLDRVAHYLPASRTGLMHARWVVVDSLIQRSTRAFYQRKKSLPALSGVLADFLQQLVAFGDSTRRAHNGDWILDIEIEKKLLGGSVREKQSATGLPIFTFQPAGRKEEIPLMQASSMVSELAPVVLYLRHVVQPGDVLIIEEPESHLHPGMQAAFTRQLAAAVRAGVRVMLTTHSDYVLEELGNLVRMSELREEQRSGIEGANVALTPDEVGVWLFEQKKRPKGSVVKEVPLDTETGIFPAGFGDVTEALYNNSVEIDSRIGESKPVK